MAYTIEFTGAPNPGDAVVEHNGVTLVVDSDAVRYLVSAEMDYFEEKLRSGFVFNDPNEKGRCDCGESFHASPRAASRPLARPVRRSERGTRGECRHGINECEAK